MIGASAFCESVTAPTLRPELSAHLAQRLQAFREGFRRNLALIGPPGGGKTFQLQQILAASPPGVAIISCPLYRESPRRFVSRLICAIVRAGLERPTDEVADMQGEDVSTLEALLHQAEGTAPRTVAAARRLEAALSTRRVDSETCMRAFDLIPLLIEERGKPCVVMLDEFLLLEELGFAQAFHELGKRVMTWPSVLFVLASSSPHRARMILRERLDLLFGQFELLELDALDPDAASSWASYFLQGFEGAEQVIPFLIDWLGTSAWHLNVVLNRLREVATLHRSETLTEAIFLQAVWDVLGSPEGPLHHWCRSRADALAHIRGGARTLEALMHMAMGARTMTHISERIGRASVTTLLNALVERDLARCSGRCWIVADPVLRCWLSTVLAAERAEQPQSPESVRERFNAFVRSLWAQWVHANQAPLAQRVAVLFARFVDETVSLDAKIGRLPKFHTVASHQPAEDHDAQYLIAEGEGKRWCAAIHEQPMDDNAIARFEAFCRAQDPRPARKIVITPAGLDQHARVLAKSVNMWVWKSGDLRLLAELYGRP